MNYFDLLDVINDEYMVLFFIKLNQIEISTKILSHVFKNFQIDDIIEYIYGVLAEMPNYENPENLEFNPDGMRKILHFIGDQISLIQNVQNREHLKDIKFIKSRIKDIVKYIHNLQLK